MLLTEGDIVWDYATSDFDRQRTTALAIDLVTKKWSAEPLWVDLRWAKDPSTLSLRHLQFRAAVLDIAAPLLGRPKDELDGEDVRQHRRTRRIAAAAGAGLVVLTISSVVAGIIANQQRKSAVSRELAARSSAEIPFDPATSLALSLEAVSVKSTDEARQALQRALIEAHGRFVLRGHNGPIRSASFSHDARLAITAGEDGTARIWDTSSGKQVSILEAQNGPLKTAEFTSDARTALTATSGGLVNVWEVASNSLKRQIGDPSRQARDVVVSSDGNLVYIAYKDENASIWDIRTGHQIASLRIGDQANSSAAFSADSSMLAIPQSGSVLLWSVSRNSREAVLGHDGKDYRDVAFSQDGQLLLAISGSPHTRSEDHVVTIWDVVTHHKKQELRGHADAILSARFSPTSARVLTASADHSARIWEAETGRTVAVLQGHKDGVLGGEFDADGGLAVTFSRDNTATVWDVETGSSLALLRGHAEWAQPIRGVMAHRGLTVAVFSPDAHLVLTAGGDGTARIWDSGAGLPAVTLRRPGEPLGSAVFHPEGKTVLTYAGVNLAPDDSRSPVTLPLPAVWDLANEQLKFQLRSKEPIKNAAYSPDGKWILSSGGTEGARIWDATTGELHSNLTGDKYVARSAVFSDDGTYAAVAAGSDLLIYNLTSGNLLRAIPTEMRTPDMPVFSPNGKSVLVRSGPEKFAAVWEIETGRRLHVFQHSGWVARAVFSPDGKLIATGSRDGSAVLWDAQTGARLHILSHGDWVNRIAFNPRGTLLATACKDNKARIWDVQTGRLQLELMAHNQGLLGIEFSRDGRFLATTSGDHTGRLFSSETGELVTEFRGAANRVMSASFSRDGDRVVTASEDGSARIYDCEVCASEERLKRLAEQRLSMWQAKSH
jgi:WD40 repeat protein